MTPEEKRVAVITNRAPGRTSRRASARRILVIEDERKTCECLCKGVGDEAGPLPPAGVNAPAAIAPG